MYNGNTAYQRCDSPSLHGQLIQPIKVLYFLTTSHGFLGIRMFLTPHVMRSCSPLITSRDVPKHFFRFSSRLSDMDQQNSPIISQQVFGSSKKIQLVNISPSDERVNPGFRSRQKRSSGSSQPMSIESLLDSNGETPFRNNHDFQRHEHASPLTAPPLLMSPPPKRRSEDYLEDDRIIKVRRRLRQTLATAPHLQQQQDSMTTLTCLHAAVAQKSYGSEKRFLCPPPIVTLVSQPGADKPKVSMGIVCGSSDTSIEQLASLDEDMQSTFRYLHVSGTAKAKQFSLRVSLSSTCSSPSSSSSSSAISSSSISSSTAVIDENDRPFATFLSNPVYIISKPSKKTAKNRTMSSCISTSAPVALFNRINSQTVSTKYMSTHAGRLCAKNSSWTPFEIIIVKQPSTSTDATTVAPSYSSTLGGESTIPLAYGMEIILKDNATGSTSPPVIVRKVEKNRIVSCAYGPVSQMQKIALQVASSANARPVYLSASGPAVAETPAAAVVGRSQRLNLSEKNNISGSTWISTAESDIKQPTSATLELAYEQVSDYLCWTIVGIAKFQYRFSQPDWTTNSITTAATTPVGDIQPAPLFSSIIYNRSTHTLDIVGQYLVQTVDGMSRLLDCWLGSYGPLETRLISTQPEQPGSTRQSTHATIKLPDTQQLLAGSNMPLQLPLLFARHDGLVYDSAKVLRCDVHPQSGATAWSILSTCSLKM